MERVERARALVSDDRVGNGSAKAGDAEKKHGRLQNFGARKAGKSNLRSETGDHEAGLKQEKRQRRREFNRPGPPTTMGPVFCLKILAVDRDTRAESAVAIWNNQDRCTR